MRRLLCLFVVASAACAPPSPEPSPPGGSGPTYLDMASAAADLAASMPADLASTDLAYRPSSLVVARPYALHVPAGADLTQPRPLLLSIHGYSGTAHEQELYFDLPAWADERAFFYAAPEGKTDVLGKHFWNATDACCDFYRSMPDDVAYLDAVIADVRAQYNIDAKRIYVLGHSNGGFMAHRFACDRANVVAAMISLSGMQWKDSARCLPTDKVSVVQIHGTSDPIVNYSGGGFVGVGPFGPYEYPSAAQTVAMWAQKNGCSAARTTLGAAFNYDEALFGNDTSAEQHASCAGTSAVELWSMAGGGHFPIIGNDARARMWDFFATHAKP